MEQEGKKWLFSGSSDFVPPHEAALSQRPNGWPEGLRISSWTSNPAQSRIFSSLRSPHQAQNLVHKHTYHTI